jgi:hypothetical protein
VELPPLDLLPFGQQPIGRTDFPFKFQRNTTQTAINNDITIEKFDNYAEDFYDTCSEYIQEWCVQFLMLLQPMDVIKLKGKVTWKNV